MGPVEIIIFLHMQLISLRTSLCLLKMEYQMSEMINGKTMETENKFTCLPVMVLYCNKQY